MKRLLNFILYFNPDIAESPDRLAELSLLSLERGNECFKAFRKIYPDIGVTDALGLSSGYAILPQGVVARQNGRHIDLSLSLKERIKRTGIEHVIIAHEAYHYMLKHINVFKDLSVSFPAVRCNKGAIMFKTRGKAFKELEAWSFAAAYSHCSVEWIFDHVIPLWRDF